MPSDSKPNEKIFLNTSTKLNSIEWVKKNTAMLVVHGIGNQLPLETLDQFGRGLIKQYRKEFGEEIKISHEIVFKPPEGSNDVWFDNVLRISKQDSDHYIDIYEYYWANYTQDKAEWKDINTWLQGVIKGANSFYKNNALLGKQYKDDSLFFDSRTGNFKVGTYRLFVSVISKLFFFIDVLWRSIMWLVSLIPYLGSIASSALQSYKDGLIHNITNVIGDVVVYNVVDPNLNFTQ